MYDHPYSAIQIDYVVLGVSMHRYPLKVLSKHCIAESPEEKLDLDKLQDSG
jgi:hypothetical protein